VFIRRNVYNANQNQSPENDQIINKFILLIIICFVIISSTLPLIDALKKLQHVYNTAIKPLENAYKYNELRQHEVSGEWMFYNILYHKKCQNEALASVKRSVFFTLIRCRDHL